MTEPLHDLAHIGHAELLTPLPEDSLRFFVELFGMEVEHRDGGSVYLRGWGDYQRYSLKLTESELPGLGHIAMRAWSQPALERRVAAIERTGAGSGGSMEIAATARPTSSPIPTATRWSCTTRASATRRPRGCSRR